MPVRAAQQHVRPDIFKAVPAIVRETKTEKTICSCKIVSCQRTTALHKHVKPHATPGSGKRKRKRRSYMATPQRQPSNYWLRFRSCSTKVSQVRGWRFSPVCCPAKSVLRRGQVGQRHFHRLAWAALNLHLYRRFHQTSASVSSVKNYSGTVVIRREAAKAVRPNHSLNRTHCSVPSFGL